MADFFSRNFVDYKRVAWYVQSAEREKIPTARLPFKIEGDLEIQNSSYNSHGDEKHKDYSQ